MDGGANVGDVMFDRNNDSQLTHEEIWDDTELIQQCDLGINQARHALASKIASESECSQEPSQHHLNGHFQSLPQSLCKSKKKKKLKRRNEWHIGDPCLSRYEADGQLYEATIVDLTQAAGVCTVRYLGYNNHESVHISSLLKSRGDSARQRQISGMGLVSQNESTFDDSSMTESDASKHERESFRKQKCGRGMPQMPSPNTPQEFTQMPFLPPFAPPPPVGLLDEGGDSSTTQAMHTMLMSWYMTGYTTGYYEGLKQGKTEPSQRK